MFMAMFMVMGMKRAICSFVVNLAGLAAMVQDMGSNQCKASKNSHKRFPEVSKLVVRKEACVDDDCHPSCHPDHWTFLSVDSVTTNESDSSNSKNKRQQKSVSFVFGRNKLAAPNWKKQKNHRNHKTVNNA